MTSWRCVMGLSTAANWLASTAAVNFLLPSWAQLMRQTSASSATTRKIARASGSHTKVSNSFSFLTVLIPYWNLTVLLLKAWLLSYDRGKLAGGWWLAGDQMGANGGKKINSYMWMFLTTCSYLQHLNDFRHSYQVPLSHRVFLCLTG